MNIKKVMATILSGAMIFAFTACGESSSSSSQSEKGSLELDMKVNDEVVPMNLYEYYFLGQKYNADLGDAKTYWLNEDGTVKQDLVNDLKKATEDEIKSVFAVKKVAADNGVTLDEQDQKKVQELYDQSVLQNGGEEQFQAILAEQGLDVQTAKDYFFQQNVLVQKLFVKLYEQQVLDTLREEDSLLRAKHILIEFTDPAAETHEEDEAKAKEVLEKVRAGEDFDKLIVEYGQDPGMESNPDGYTFKEGDMVPEFYEGTKALANDEVSDLVKSSFGYHIIKRLEMDYDKFAEDIKTNDSIMMYMTEEMQKDFDEKVKAIQNELVVTYNQEAYDAITYNTFDPEEPAVEESASTDASDSSSALESPSDSSDQQSESTPSEQASSENTPAEEVPSESTAS